MTHLTLSILKNIMTAAEWSKVRDKIHYSFTSDHYYTEFKHQETMTQRMALARDMEDFVGRYYSKEWYRAQILRQSEDEIVTQDELIAKEAEEEGTDFNRFPGPKLKDIEVPRASALDPILRDYANSHLVVQGKGSVHLQIRHTQILTIIQLRTRPNMPLSSTRLPQTSSTRMSNRTVSSQSPPSSTD